jgi:hypothetical protein
MQATEAPTPPDAVVEMVRLQQNVIELIREILDDTQPDCIVADERVDLRYPFCVPIEVTPFDDQGGLSGGPLATVTKDISAGGIAFLNTAEVTGRYVVVRFPRVKRNADQRVVVEVRYCRRLGPLWQIGGRFLVEW